MQASEQLVPWCNGMQGTGRLGQAPCMAGMDERRASSLASCAAAALQRCTGAPSCVWLVDYMERMRADRWSGSRAMRSTVSGIQMMVLMSTGRGIVQTRGGAQACPKRMMNVPVVANCAIGFTIAPSLDSWELRSQPSGLPASDGAGPSRLHGLVGAAAGNPGEIPALNRKRKPQLPLPKFAYVLLYTYNRLSKSPDQVPLCANAFPASIVVLILLPTSSPFCEQAKQIGKHR